jgi:GxxExxY protein
MVMLYVDSPLSPEIELVMTSILDCAFAVHRELGPGFKERIYHTAMCLELDSRGIPFESEKVIEVKYRDWTIPGQRLDLLVAGAVVVEVKAIPDLKPLHRRQVVSYLKAAGLQAGLLLNFNTMYLKMGIRRVVRTG